MDTQRLEEQCPTCLGRDGHHQMNCPELTGADTRVDTESDTPRAEQGEREQLDQLAEDRGKPMYDKYSVADLEEAIEAGHGSSLEEAAKYLDGKRNDLDETLDQSVPEGVETFDEQKLPPTLGDMQSNEMLWLVAKICHEVNRAFCREVIMDHSHLPWEDTAPELRASIYEGVVAHFENPELTPEESHQKWLDYKAAEGWTFGNNKDVQAKTHPCMLPYAQLHAHDRAKDHLFAAVCKSMFGTD